VKFCLLQSSILESSSLVIAIASFGLVFGVGDCGILYLYLIDESSLSSNLSFTGNGASSIVYSRV
jgi:hypothetical protein